MYSFDTGSTLRDKKRLNRSTRWYKEKKRLLETRGIVEISKFSVHLYTKDPKGS